MSTEEGVKGSEENLRRKGRTKLGCWMMGCATPIGLILLLVVVFFVWRAQSVAAISQIEAEITARGEPLNVEEVNRRYRQIGDAKSKTLLFQELFEKLVDERFQADCEWLPIVGLGDYPPDDLTTPWQQEREVADFFTKHAELLDELETAALAEGEVRFPHDFGAIYTSSVPAWSRYPESARLLDLQARFAAHSGDSDQAFRSLLAFFALAETLSFEPSGNHHTVGLAIHNLANGTTVKCLPFTNWTNAQIEQLIEASLARDWRSELAYVLASERAIYRSKFGDPEAFSLMRSSWAPATRFEDERFYLQFMADYIRATNLPFPDFYAEMKRIEDEYAVRYNQGATIDHVTHDLSYLLIGMNSSLANSFAEAEALDQAAVAQLAIELYQRKHGHPPAILSDLVPQYLPVEPIDPFNRLPLKYLVNDTEIIVSTVGGDDLESVMETDKDGRPLEYALRVPRK